MGLSCTRVAHIKTPEGRIVESNLFNDLLKYTGSRKLTKEFYFVGTNPEFLNRVRTRAKFDQYGQIKAESLINILQIQPSDTITDTLERNAGINPNTDYSYAEASLKVASFNRESHFREKYMATLVPSEGGNYKVKIVKKSRSETSKLKDTIKNQTLTDRLMYYLRAHGVDATFMAGEEGKNATGRFSLANATQTAASIRALIQIATGQNVEGALAEQAGHVAIGITRQHPLTIRLRELLGPKNADGKYDQQRVNDVMLAVLGTEFNTRFAGVVNDDVIEEVAGILVGRALENKSDQKTTWGRLASRIANVAKKIMSVFQSKGAREIMALERDVEKVAEEIAEGFVSSSFQTLSEETMFHEEKSLTRNNQVFNVNSLSTVTAYRNTVMQLNQLAKELSAVTGEKISESVERIVKEMEKNRSNIINTSDKNFNMFTEQMVVEGIASAAISLSDLMVAGGKITTLLDSINLKDTASFIANASEYGRSLQQVQLFIERVDQITLAIKQVLSQMESFDEKGNPIAIQVRIGGATITSSVTSILTNLERSKQMLNDALHTKQVEFFCALLSETYGKNFVARTSRRLFTTKDGKWRMTTLAQLDEEKANSNPQGGRKYDEQGIQRQDVKDSTTPEGLRRNGLVRDRLESLEDDDSLFCRFLASASNSTDLIIQLADKMMKQASYSADTNTRDAWDTLRELEAQFNEIQKDNPDIKDASIFYERDANGELTGNFISETNVGMWEEARKDFMDREKKAFKEAHPEAAYYSDTLQAMLWNEWIKPKLKKWNDENSKWVKEAVPVYNRDGSYVIIQTERWKPNDKYANPEFRRLIPANSKIEEVYTGLRNLKVRFDSVLPAHCTMYERVPQFTADFVGRVGNMHSIGELPGVVRKQINDVFAINSDESEYGSLLTYNDEDQALFNGKESFSADKVKRIPIFGVNKLSKRMNFNGEDKRVISMEKLSRDIFKSMVAYASMAYSYSATNEIVSTLEVGKSILHHSRTDKTQGGKTENKTSSHSRKFSRYSDYLDKQVYNLSYRYMTKERVLMSREDREREDRRIKFNTILAKVMNVLTQYSAFRFLAGNLHGGMVNLGTGIFEILKEAGAGQFITRQDVMAASKIYFSNVISDFSTIVQDYNPFNKNTLGMYNNKVAMFIHKFDATNEGDREFRAFDTRHSRLLNAMGKTLYFPYKAGDNLMQAIPFLAVANSIKLYGASGDRTVTLYEAYSKVDLAHGAGKTLRMTEPYFKSKEDRAMYYKIQDLINEVQQQINSGANIQNIFSNGGRGTFLSEALLAKLRDVGITSGARNQTEVNDVVKSLQKLRDSYKWNEADESNYKNKARELANRLHGVYNRLDKPAFTQNIMCNSMLGMKGWAIGMAQRRWEGIFKPAENTSKFSIMLNEDTEGSNTTVIRTLIPDVIMGILGKDHCVGIEGLLRFALLPRASKGFFKSFGYSDTQIANLIRAQGDMLLITCLGLLRCLIAGDDDDDNELGVLYYFANRLFREQTALDFIPFIPGSMSEAHNLVDIVPVNTSALADLLMFAWEIYGAATHEVTDERFFYQTSKEGKHEKGDPKAWSHFKRMVPYWKSAYVFTHGYQAAKDFEFGRRVKTR